jgi:hypothetical protein
MHGAPGPLVMHGAPGPLVMHGGAGPAALPGRDTDPRRGSGWLGATRRPSGEQ